MKQKSEAFDDYNSYKDRSIMKWGGYFMSDHTQRMAEDRKDLDIYIDEKDLLTEEQIFKEIDKAVRKNKNVSIQMQETDGDGSYFPDIIGRIVTGDERGLYITNKKEAQRLVPFDMIRHIEIVEVDKWWGRSVS